MNNIFIYAHIFTSFIMSGTRKKIVKMSWVELSQQRTKVLAWKEWANDIIRPDKKVLKSHKKVKAKAIQKIYTKAFSSPTCCSIKEFVDRGEDGVDTRRSISVTLTDKWVSGWSAVATCVVRTLSIHLSIYISQKHTYAEGGWGMEN